ncbi:hypothetical protein APHCRT_0157 [Anaplasma phagocytophilum str. CRT53-1]|uniref:Uncharacterized protein n=1 Tax=Anaplasma phagocytophilum str. CRT53-1 TaxID=1359157 RepID=A0A0F3Q815_ANAPH|nr:hypothetical protein APHCRT_0157 [Anaplasma phagocytophilum str. CRT53-1]
MSRSVICGYFVAWSQVLWTRKTGKVVLVSKPKESTVTS